MTIAIQSPRKGVASQISKAIPALMAWAALAGLSFFASSAQAFPVQVATAPENTLPLIRSAIQSAKKSLLVNIYELSSPEVAQDLIDQINRGVHVEILQEGEPVGGIAAAAHGLHSRIAQAMESHPGDRYVEMHRSAQGTRRYRFDHAKYIVVDGSSLLLGSENYSPGGQPEPGTQGNRGWEVFVQNETPARWFAQLFAHDSDPSNSDIQSLLSSKSRAMTETYLLPTASAVVPFSSRVNPVYNATSGQIITSPETSLKGLVALIQSARSSLDIEEMSFALEWRQATTDSNAQPTVLSPLADAILTVARRGVHVRILLNDENAFINGGQDGDTEKPLAVSRSYFGTNSSSSSSGSSSGNLTQNRRTIAALLAVAQKEKLPLDARIADLQAMHVTYIHNKGLIVDRQTTLISSINWTQNSVQNNRESGLVLTSSQIAAFFGRAFEQDWQNSASKGRAMYDFVAAATANAAVVPDSVEIPCPSALQVALKIGDIHPSQNSDPSYGELQGRTMSAKFVRDRRATQHCILLGPSNAVIEFKILPKTTQLACEVEGFTSTNKPFAVLGLLPKDTALGTPGTTVTIQGAVIEGTSEGGGRRRKLGVAAVQLVTQQ